MNGWVLLWRNLMYRKTLSLLTVLAVAVTVALLVFLLLCSDGLEQGAEKGYGPFEVTIGAQGSESQLALSTYYHVGAPTGNIPFDVYEQVRRENDLDAAYAMTTGDNYNGFPVVGIDTGYFLTRYGDKQLQAGRLYAKLGETVVGAYVAKSLHLRVGDTFHGAHGLVEGAADEVGDEDEHAQFAYTIVGILPPLRTPDDRAVFTTLDYAWAVHHAEQSGAERQVTAIMVKPKSLLGTQAIKLKYDKMNQVQAIYSSKAVADVVNVVDKGGQAVSVVTALCIVLAAISVLLSLIAAVNERQKDVGLLRLLGKSRTFIWFALLGEGLLLTGIGLVLGLIAGHVGGYFGRDAVFAFSGVQIDAWRVMPDEWAVAAGTLIVGALSSLGPALKAYRVDPLQLFRA